MARETIAYWLIASVLLIGVPWFAIMLARRRKQKLRRKGIKTYGH